MFTNKGAKIGENDMMSEDEKHIADNQKESAINNLARLMNEFVNEMEEHPVEIITRTTRNMHDLLKTQCSKCRMLRVMVRDKNAMCPETPEKPCSFTNNMLYPKGDEVLLYGYYFPDYQSSNNLRNINTQQLRVQPALKHSSSSLSSKPDVTSLFPHIGQIVRERPPNYKFDSEKSADLTYQPLTLHGYPLDKPRPSASLDKNQGSDSDQRIGKRDVDGQNPGKRGGREKGAVNKAKLPGWFAEIDKLDQSYVMRAALYLYEFVGCVWYQQRSVEEIRQRLKKGILY
jgi:hypothetical protein